MKPAHWLRPLYKKFFFKKTACFDLWIICTAIGFAPQRISVFGIRIYLFISQLLRITCLPHRRAPAGYLRSTCPADGDETDDLDILHKSTSSPVLPSVPSRGNRTILLEVVLAGVSRCVTERRWIAHETQAPPNIEPPPSRNKKASSDIVKKEIRKNGIKSNSKIQLV